MDSQNQLQYFCYCIVIGFIGGVIYQFFSWTATFFKAKKKGRKWLQISLDIAFFAAFATFVNFAAYRFQFPSFRVYMWIGYIVGGIIYAKTLRKFLAFLGKVCYNTHIQRQKTRKLKKKLSQTGG